jgi:hypothetical protein
MVGLLTANEEATHIELKTQIKGKNERYPNSIGGGWHLGPAAGLYPAQIGDKHMNERCLSGDKQRKQCQSGRKNRKAKTRTQT